MLLHGVDVVVVMLRGEGGVDAVGVAVGGRGRGGGRGGRRRRRGGGGGGAGRAGRVDRQRRRRGLVQTGRGLFRVEKEAGGWVSASPTGLLSDELTKKKKL